MVFGEMEIVESMTLINLLSLGVDGRNLGVKGVTINIFRGGGMYSPSKHLICNASNFSKMLFLWTKVWLEPEWQHVSHDGLVSESKYRLWTCPYNR